MSRVLRKRFLAIGVAATVVFGLSACGGDGDAESAAEKTTTTAEPSETPEASESADSSEADEQTGAANQPAWAAEVTTPGEKLTTIKVGDITVDVYQVDVVKATKTGHFVLPESNKPVIDVGDEVVYVNYVITNNGEPVDLGSSLVDVEPRYDDWKYMQGMDSVTDSEQREQVGIHTSGIEPGKNADPAVYTLGRGESFSYGSNFKYQKNSPIEFEVAYVPVDAKGDLLHDKKVEASGKTTIK